MSLLVIALSLAVVEATTPICHNPADELPKKCHILCSSGDKYGWDCEDYTGADGKPMQLKTSARSECPGKSGKYWQLCSIEVFEIPTCGRTAAEPEKCKIKCSSGGTLGWDCKDYTGANNEPMELIKQSTKECFSSSKYAGRYEKDCGLGKPKGIERIEHEPTPIKPEIQTHEEYGLCESEICKGKCDMGSDVPAIIDVHVSGSATSEISYEFYGSKSSKHGGVERHGDEIKCNEDILFRVIQRSKTENPTQPWKWMWQLVDTPHTYVHVDGLIFKPLETETYFQLLPKDRKHGKKQTGCILKKEISYVGRRWAYDNGDLANYNLFLWTMGNTEKLASLGKMVNPVHRAIFCHGKQAGMWCQVYAQNNVLQYRVDDTSSYTEYSHKITGKKTKKMSHRLGGFEGSLLKPGFERFGVTPLLYGKDSSTETLETITPELMIKHRCIGVLVQYIVQIMELQEGDKKRKIKGKYVGVKSGGHFIAFKYLGTLGWFWFDSNVIDPHGPFETLVAAEKDANDRQLERNDHRKMSAITSWIKRKGKQGASLGYLGNGKKSYWSITPRYNMVYMVNKDDNFARYVDEIADKSKSISGSSAIKVDTAKSEVYDVMDVENYENDYDMYESIYWKLFDFSIISMEIMILLLFLCCGMCWFAIIGSVGFSAGYLVDKHQLYEKVNAENEEQV